MRYLRAVSPGEAKVIERTRRVPTNRDPWEGPDLNIIYPPGTVVFLLSAMDYGAVHVLRSCIEACLSEHGSAYVVDLVADLTVERDTSAFKWPSAVIHRGEIDLTDAVVVLHAISNLDAFDRLFSSGAV